MIRINLIQKKQASYVSGAEGGKSSGGGGLSALQSLSSGGAEGFITLFKSIGIPVILCIAANFGYDYYIQQKTDEMTQEVSKLDSDKERINKELSKIKGFESVKVELERDQLVLRTKIETIEKLIRGRDFTAKSLITLAQAMPRDIWMTEIKATETGFELKGGTVDLGLVSDFMSRLGQTIYFKDVTLKSTATDSSGHQASFELGARRE
jgi:Tfp pilus assembly protein PilN